MPRPNPNRTNAQTDAIIQQATQELVQEYQQQQHQHAQQVQQAANDREAINAYAALMAQQQQQQAAAQAPQVTQPAAQGQAQVTDVTGGAVNPYDAIAAQPTATPKSAFEANNDYFNSKLKPESNNPYFFFDNNAPKGTLGRFATQKVYNFDATDAGTGKESIHPVVGREITNTVIDTQTTTPEYKGVNRPADVTVTDEEIAKYQDLSTQTNKLVRSRLVPAQQKFEQISANLTAINDRYITPVDELVQQYMSATDETAIDRIVKEFNSRTGDTHYKQAIKDFQKLSDECEVAYKEYMEVAQQLAPFLTELDNQYAELHSRGYNIDPDEYQAYADDQERLALNLDDEIRKREIRLEYTKDPAARKQINDELDDLRRQKREAKDQADTYSKHANTVREEREIAQKCSTILSDISGNPDADELLAKGYESMPFVYDSATGSIKQAAQNNLAGTSASNANKGQAEILSVLENDAIAFMSKDEADAIAYTYVTQGAAAAKELAKEINHVCLARRSRDKTRNLAKWFDAPSHASVDDTGKPQSVIGQVIWAGQQIAGKYTKVAERYAIANIGALAADFGQKLTTMATLGTAYLGRDENSSVYDLVSFSSAVRGMTASSIDATTWGKWVDEKTRGYLPLSLLYEAGYSMADMYIGFAAANALGGAAEAAGLGEKAVETITKESATAFLSTGAFAPAMRQAKAAGAGDVRSYLAGLSATIVEYGTEHLMTEKWLDSLAKASKGIKKNALQWVTMGFEEGLEEGVSDILKRFVTEPIVLGGLSEYEQNVRNAILAGSTAEDARKQASREFWQGVVRSSLSGALAGVFGTGVSNAIAKYNAPAVAATFTETDARKHTTEDYLSDMRDRLNDAVENKKAKADDRLALKKLNAILNENGELKPGFDASKFLSVLNYAEENNDVGYTGFAKAFRLIVGIEAEVNRVSKMQNESGAQAQTTVDENGAEESPNAYDEETAADAETEVDAPDGISLTVKTKSKEDITLTGYDADTGNYIDSNANEVDPSTLNPVGRILAGTLRSYRGSSNRIMSIYRSGININEYTNAVEHIFDSVRADTSVAFGEVYDADSEVPRDVQRQLYDAAVARYANNEVERTQPVRRNSEISQQSIDKTESGEYNKTRTEKENDNGDTLSDNNVRPERTGTLSEDRRADEAVSRSEGQERATTSQERSDSTGQQAAPTNGLGQASRLASKVNTAFRQGLRDWSKSGQRARARITDKPSKLASQIKGELSNITNSEIVFYHRDNATAPLAFYNEGANALFIADEGNEYTVRFFAYHELGHNLPELRSEIESRLKAEGVDMAAAHTAWSAYRAMQAKQSGATLIEQSDTERGYEEFVCDLAGYMMGEYPVSMVANVFGDAFVGAALDIIRPVMQEYLNSGAFKSSMQGEGTKFAQTNPIQFAEDDRFEQYMAEVDRSQVRQSEPLLDKYVATIAQRGVTKEISEYYLGLAQKHLDDNANATEQEALARLVRAAAATHGYSEKLYHGTEDFGFTQIDTQGQSDDGISFWATASLETASTYSGRKGIRRIAPQGGQISASDANAYIDQVKELIAELADYVNSDEDSSLDGYLDGTPSFNERAQYELLRDLMYGIELGEVDVDEIEDEVLEYINDHFFMFDEAFPIAKQIAELFETAGGEMASMFTHKDLPNASEFFTNGIYEFYCNTDGFLSVDCNNHGWNQIRDKNLPAKPNGKPYTTRQVVKYAKEHGYAGVMFKSVIDPGMSGSHGVQPANVYAFLDPATQVKSADPVTVDNNGNIIPLEDRFNPKVNETRFAQTFPEPVGETEWRRLASLSDEDLAEEFNERFHGLLKARLQTPETMLAERGKYMNTALDFFNKMVDILDDDNFESEFRKYLEARYEGDTAEIIESELERQLEIMDEDDVVSTLRDLCETLEDQRDYSNDPVYREEAGDNLWESFPDMVDETRVAISALPTLIRDYLDTNKFDGRIWNHGLTDEERERFYAIEYKIQQETGLAALSKGKSKLYEPSFVLDTGSEVTLNEMRCCLYEKDTPLNRLIFAWDKFNYSADLYGKLVTSDPSLTFIARLSSDDAEEVQEAKEDFKSLVNEAYSLHVLDRLESIYMTDEDGVLPDDDVFKFITTTINERFEKLYAETKKPHKGKDFNIQERPYSVDELRSMYYQLDTAHKQELRPLADKVFAIAEQIEKRKAEQGETFAAFVREFRGSNDAAGKYFYAPDKVEYKIDAFNKASQEAQACVILHELIHACTSYYVQVDHYRIPGAPMDTIDRILNLLQAFSPVANEQYGTTNDQEFLAELSNPTFRNLLRVHGAWESVRQGFESLYRIAETEKTPEVIAARQALNDVVASAESEAVILHGAAENEIAQLNEARASKWDAIKVPDSILTDLDMADYALNVILDNFNLNWHENERDDYRNLYPDWRLATKFSQANFDPNEIALEKAMEVFVQALHTGKGFALEDEGARFGQFEKARMAYAKNATLDNLNVLRGTLRSLPIEPGSDMYEPWLDAYREVDAAFKRAAEAGVQAQIRKNQSNKYSLARINQAVINVVRPFMDFIESLDFSTIVLNNYLNVAKAYDTWASTRTAESSFALADAIDEYEKVFGGKRGAWRDVSGALRIYANYKMKPNSPFYQTTFSVDTTYDMDGFILDPGETYITMHRGSMASWRLMMGKDKGYAVVPSLGIVDINSPFMNFKGTHAVTGVFKKDFIIDENGELKHPTFKGDGLTPTRPPTSMFVSQSFVDDMKQRYPNLASDEKWQAMYRTLNQMPVNKHLEGESVYSQGSDAIGATMERGDLIESLSYMILHGIAANDVRERQKAEQAKNDINAAAYVDASGETVDTTMKRRGVDNAFRSLLVRMYNSDHSRPPIAPITDEESLGNWLDKFIEDNFTYDMVFDKSRSWDIDWENIPDNFIPADDLDAIAESMSFKKLPDTGDRFESAEELLDPLSRARLRTRAGIEGASYNEVKPQTKFLIKDQLAFILAPAEYYTELNNMFNGEVPVYTLDETEGDNREEQWANMRRAMYVAFTGAKGEAIGTQTRFSQSFIPFEEVAKDMETIERLGDELDEANETIGQLKSELTLTDRNAVNVNAISRLAAKIQSSYKSTVGDDTIFDFINEFAERAQADPAWAVGRKGLRWLYNRMLMVVDQHNLVNDEMWEACKGFRNELYKGVALTKEQKQALRSSLGNNWNSLANFAMGITNKGASLRNVVSKYVKSGLLSADLLALDDADLVLAVYDYIQAARPRITDELKGDMTLEQAAMIEAASIQEKVVNMPEYRTTADKIRDKFLDPHSNATKTALRDIRARLRTVKSGIDDLQELIESDEDYAPEYTAELERLQSESDSLQKLLDKATEDRHELSSLNRRLRSVSNRATKLLDAYNTTKRTLRHTNTLLAHAQADAELTERTTNRTRADIIRDNFVNQNSRAMQEWRETVARNLNDIEQRYEAVEDRMAELERGTEEYNQAVAELEQLRKARNVWRYRNAHANELALQRTRLSDYRKAQSEAKRRRAARASINKVMSKMRQWVLRPNKKHHVPEQFRADVATILQQVSTLSLSADAQASQATAEQMIVNAKSALSRAEQNMVDVRFKQSSDWLVSNGDITDEDVSAAIDTVENGDMRYTEANLLRVALTSAGVPANEIPARIDAARDNVNRNSTEMTEARMWVEDARLGVSDAQAYLEAIKANGVSNAQRNAVASIGELIGKMQSDENNTVDLMPFLSEQVKAIAESGKPYLYSATVEALSADELESLAKLMRSLMRSIVDYNRSFALANKQSIDELRDEYEEFFDEHYINGESTVRKAANTKDGKSPISDLVSIRNMIPVYFAEYLGGESTSVGRVLLACRDANNQHHALIKQAADYIADNKEIAKNLYKWTHDKVKVTLNVRGSGREVTVNIDKSALMELYLLSKRPHAKDNLLHQGLGGIKFEDDVLHQSKQSNAKNSDVFTLNQAKLDELIGLLTPEERDAADYLQAFMDTCAEWGNKVSMQLWDYKMFNEDSYWHMTVDSTARDTTQQDMQQGGSLRVTAPALRNGGVTNPVQENSRKPLVIGNVFQNFSGHVSFMAAYGAFVPVLEDMTRLYNAKFKMHPKTGEMSEALSVKDAIARLYGDVATKYWTDFTRTLNGVNRNGDAAALDIYDKVVSRIMKGRIWANGRVVVQQPVAIARALVYLDADCMARGMTHNALHLKRNIREASDGSSAMWWKAHGNREIHQSRSMYSVLFNQSSNVFEAIGEAGMKPAGFADTVTWAAIWKACEYQSIKNDKSLKNDAQALKEATATLFSKVIDYTQVTDDVLHRSMTMRSKNFFDKISGAYMSEPTMTQNMLAHARYMVKRAERGEQKVAAKKFAARTVAAFLVNAAVLAAVTGFYDALRDKRKKDKGFLTRAWEHSRSNVIDELNPLGRIPYIKSFDLIANGKIDLFEVGEGLLSGETRDFYQALRDSGIGVFGSLWKTYRNITSNGFDSMGAVPFEALSDLTTKIDQFVNAPTVFGKLYALSFLTEYSGMGVKNAYRDILAIINELSVMLGGEIKVDYSTPSGTYTIDTSAQKAKSAAKVNRIADYYNAIISGDVDAINHARTKLVDSTEGIDTEDDVEAVLKGYLSGINDDGSFNEPRIADMATAKDTGDINEYNRLLGEMVAQGFERDTVMDAVESMRNTSYDKYAAALYNAMLSGDTEAIVKATDDWKAYTYNGTTDAEMDTYFAKYLAKHDERIADMVDARVNGNLKELERLYSEAEAQGFKENVLLNAEAIYLGGGNTLSLGISGSKDRFYTADSAAWYVFNGQLDNYEKVRQYLSEQEKPTSNQALAKSVISTLKDAYIDANASKRKELRSSIETIINKSVRKGNTDDANWKATQLATLDYYDRLAAAVSKTGWNQDELDIFRKWYSQSTESLDSSSYSVSTASDNNDKLLLDAVKSGDLTSAQATALWMYLHENGSTKDVNTVTYATQTLKVPVADFISWQITKDDVEWKESANGTQAEKIAYAMSYSKNANTQQMILNTLGMSDFSITSYTNLGNKAKNCSSFTALDKDTQDAILTELTFMESGTHYSENSDVVSCYERFAWMFSPKGTSDSNASYNMLRGRSMYLGAQSAMENAPDKNDDGHRDQKKALQSYLGKQFGSTSSAQYWLMYALCKSGSLSKAEKATVKRVINSLGSQQRQYFTALLGKRLS